MTLATRKQGWRVSYHHQELAVESIFWGVDSQEIKAEVLCLYSTCGYNSVLSLAIINTYLISGIKNEHSNPSQS